MKVHALEPFLPCKVACEMDCGKNQNKTEPEVNVKNRCEGSCCCAQLED